MLVSFVSGFGPPTQTCSSHHANCKKGKPIPAVQIHNKGTMVSLGPGSGRQSIGINSRTTSSETWCECLKSLIDSSDDGPEACGRPHCLQPGLVQCLHVQLIIWSQKIQKPAGYPPFLGSLTPTSSPNFEEVSSS